MDKAGFLERVRQHIKRTEGVSATSLALQAGMANTTIRNWFDGKASPSMTSAEKVLAAIGISYEEFMRDIGVPPDGIADLWPQLTSDERRFLRITAQALIADRRAGETER